MCLIFGVPAIRYYSDWKSYKDSTGKKNLKNNQEELTRFIKNIYKILMSRAHRGCYVYFVDKETEKFFKSRIKSVLPVDKLITSEIASSIVYEMIALPMFESVGCGELMYADPTIQEMIPVRKDYVSKGLKHFVLRTSGDSMNKAGINDGDLVLCRKDYHPTEGDKVVALIGDDATIKEYRRENGYVVLKPHSTNPIHKPLKFRSNEEVKVQGVVVRVLDK